MFDNIGGKIKGLAKVMFWIEAIAFVIIGIYCFAKSGDYYRDESVYIACGCITMFGGPILALISSWFIYGFGELIELVADIDYQLGGSEVSVRRINTLKELEDNGLINSEDTSKIMEKFENFSELSVEQKLQQINNDCILGEITNEEASARCVEILSKL